MKLPGLVFFFLLAGCTGPQAATPLSTPQTLTITMTPAIQPIQQAIHRCAILQPEVAIVVSDLPAPFNKKRAADLVFRLGEPPDITSYAASIAWENIAIIVHPDNPIKALNLGQLRGLFTGQIHSWAAVGGVSRAVQVWTYPDGDDARQVFNNVVLANDSLSFDAMLAPDPTQMIHEISADPGAIGFVPGAWLTTAVKDLELGPDLSANMRQPVLALAPAEPQGATRRFLSCLQSGAGHEELIQKYHP